MLIPKEYRKEDYEPINAAEARQLQSMYAEQARQENLHKNLRLVYAAIRKAALKGLSGTRIAHSDSDTDFVAYLVGMGYTVHAARDMECDHKKLVGYDINW